MTNSAIEARTPKALGFNFQQVESIAANIAKQLNFRPGDDLKEIVTRLGGKITYFDFWTKEGSKSGSIIVAENKDGKSEFEIRLALDTGILRDRFTIAHELGHFILHFLYRKQILNEEINELEADRYGGGPAENEANWFAASFLMPKEEYIQKYHDFSGNHYSLSEYFKVSKRASEVRAEVLKIAK